MTYDKIPSDASYIGVANISFAFSLYYERIVIVVNKYIKFSFCNYMFIKQFFFFFFSSIDISGNTMMKGIRNVENKWSRDDSGTFKVQNYI